MVPLLDAPNLTVVPIAGNLVDLVWTSQPSRPTTLIDLHPIQFTGALLSSQRMLLVRTDIISSFSVRSACVKEDQGVPQGAHLDLDVPHVRGVLPVDPR